MTGPVVAYRWPASDSLSKTAVSARLGTELRWAFTMLELLISIVIFVIALVPIANLFIVSQRTTYASERVLRAAAHGQSVLEGILQLEACELPTLAPDKETMLILEEKGSVSITPGPPKTATCKGRWQEVAAYFRDTKPPFPFQARVVTGTLIEDKFPIPALRKPNRYLIKVMVEFARLTHDRKESGTVQQVVVQGMLTPEQ